MRIYLDNCRFNRPYDDQRQLSVSLDAQAKIYVQDKIKLTTDKRLLKYRTDKLELITPVEFVRRLEEQI